MLMFNAPNTEMVKYTAYLKSIQEHVAFTHMYFIVR